MSNLAPSPSPLRPVNPLVRRKYPQPMIYEALKLCHSDGVAYAEKMTGVKAASLYKILKPSARTVKPAKTPKAKPESPEKLLLRSPQWAKIKALALYYHASVPNDSLRNAFTRAATKLGYEVKTVWRCYKLSIYSQ